MNFLKSIPARIATMALLLSLVLVSCSKTESAGGRADLLAYVPDDATLTLAFSPAAIMKSAGVEVSSDGLTLPKSLERLLSSNSEVYNIVKLISSAKGVDYNCAVVAGGTTDGCALFALNDAGKFISWAKSNGLTVESEGDYTVCYTDATSPAIVIDGFAAWFIGSAEKDRAISIVDKCKASAADNKLAKWKLPLLTKGDVDLIINMKSYSEELSNGLAMIGMSNVTDMYQDDEVYSAANFNFDGPTLRITGEVYDREGKVTPIVADKTYTSIAKDFVNLVKGSQFAFAFTIPEKYKNMLNTIIGNETYGMTAEQKATVNSLVGAIRNAAFGLSMDEKCVIINSQPSDLSATLALNLDKPQFANAMSTLLTGFPDPQISEAMKAWVDNTSATIHPIPGVTDFSLTFCGAGDFAVASTDESKARTKINPSNLTDIIAYFKIDLPKSHPLPSIVNCPFGIDAEGVTTVMTSDYHVTLTDTDTPFLEAILNFVARF